MEQNEKTSSRLVEKGKFHIQKQTTTFWKPLGMLLLLCTKMYFLTTTKKQINFQRIVKRTFLPKFGSNWQNLFREENYNVKAYGCRQWSNLHGSGELKNT